MEEVYMGREKNLITILRFLVEMSVGDDIDAKG